MFYFDSDNLDYTLDSPKLQLFDYEPVLSKKLHGLGNISITNFDTEEQGFLFLEPDYEHIKNDIDSGNLVAADFQLIFNKTVKPAKMNNTNIRDQSEIIIVRYTVSIHFDYNSSASGFVLYKTNLQPSYLKQVYLNGTLLPEKNYTIDSEDAFVYNYRKHHTAENGTLIFSFIFNYEININNWNINQYPNQDLYMINKIHTFSVDFNYGFSMRAFTLTSQGSLLQAENLTLYFLFCIEDSEKLYNFEYSIGNNSQNIISHKNSLNWFNGSLLANNTQVSLNFTVDFTVGFKDICYDFWAIDRLVSDRNIRERIYFLEIINGPSGFYLEDIQFNELYIYYPRFKDVSTNFERIPNVLDLNTTGGGGLSPTPGLKISVPYFIKNEIIAVIIKYEAIESLSVQITDQISMPLEGVFLKFFYFNQTYGTYISTLKSQPLPLKITNSAGRVILNNMPIGNYTIEVYNFLGQFVTNGTANPSIDLNYINTSVPHFPTWIVFFTTIYSIILGLGVWIYKKNLKPQ